MEISCLVFCVKTFSMRKKHKIYQCPTVKIEPLPKAFVTAVSVNNLQEQKARFLKHGKTPIFVMEGDKSTVEELATKCSGKIRFDLLGEAEYIINTVKLKYGKGENYLDQIYGPRIDQNEANEILFDYIGENSLQESLAVYWSNDMPCSARMVWKGYSFKCNRPELRRYALWLNGTYENPYLRRHGLRCLLDHEIGTHFYRSYNDGFQPWFYDRKKFGLRGTGSFESLCTEEGLAAINTTLRAKEKYLWLSALTYYTACKSTEMTFKQLFDHLGQFVDNPEQRWKHVMRVKRGLVDPNDLGGYGKDQCYFEGAVSILRNIDDINFNLLMSGKICYDEVSRVKRLARLGSICLPAIMRDMDTYHKQLKRIAVINGLHLEHPTYQPSRAYVQRLKERQAGIHRKRKVRKGKKTHSSPFKVSGSQSEQSQSTSGSESIVVWNAPPGNLGGPRPTAYEACCVGEGSSSNMNGPDSPSASGVGVSSQSAHQRCYHGAEDDKSSKKVGRSKINLRGTKRSLIPIHSSTRKKERPHTAATMGTCTTGLLPEPPQSVLQSESQSSLRDSSAGMFGICCPTSDEQQSLCEEDWLNNLSPLSPSTSSSPSLSPSHCMQLLSPCLLPPLLAPSLKLSLPPIGREEKASAGASSGGEGCSSQEGVTCEPLPRTSGGLMSALNKHMPHLSS